MIKKYKYIAKNLKEHLRQKNLQQTFNYTRRSINKLNKGGIERGHARMNCLTRYMMLADRKIERSEDQITMHDKMICALIPFAYGDALIGNEKEIMEYNNVSKLYAVFVAMMPRRFGKSQCAALLAAIAILAFPHYKVLIITNNTRSASSEMGMLQKIKDYLLTIFNINTFQSNNKEVLSYAYSDSDIRYVYAFSADAGDGQVCLFIYSVRLFFFILL